MIYKRIETALKDAISFHNDGLSANEAIAKSASQHELNPETICRVVESFNIAKTRAYIKTASVKDADFDTANKTDVIKMVFDTDCIKTAGSPVKKSHPLEYKFEIKKTALELIMEKKAEFKDVDVNANIINAKQAQEGANLDLTTARGDIVFVRESFIKALEKAASFFSYSYNIDNADEIFDAAAYQYLGNKVANDVIELISKTASLDYTVPENPTPKDYGQHSFHETIDGMIDDAEDYALKVAEYNNAIDEQSKKTSELNGLILKVAGLSKDKGADFLFASEQKKIAFKFEKFPEDIIADISADLFHEKVAKEEAPKVSASSFLKKADSIGVPIPLAGKIDLGKIPISHSMESDAGNKTKDLEEKGYLARLTRGNESSDRDAVDAEMQNVQRQALVHDLIANDEIISTYDPKVSLSAYNTMLKLAPKASLMPDVVRSVLRYATAQTIDPNYASQLVELENNLNKREGNGDQKK